MSDGFGFGVSEFVTNAAQPQSGVSRCQLGFAERVFMSCRLDENLGACAQFTFVDLSSAPFQVSMIPCTRFSMWMPCLTDCDAIVMIALKRWQDP